MKEFSWVSFSLSWWAADSFYLLWRYDEQLLKKDQNGFYFMHASSLLKPGADITHTAAQPLHALTPVCSVWSMAHVSNKDSRTAAKPRQTFPSSSHTTRVRTCYVWCCSVGFSHIYTHAYHKCFIFTLMLTQVVLMFSLLTLSHAFTQFLHSAFPNCLM